MQGYIERFQTDFIKKRLEKVPVVAILGPRQCGKTTLAKHIITEIPDSIYLDLESPRDLRKLNDPETFFDDNRNRVVCLDEIQRRPDLFSSLRSIIDRSRKNGHIILLGSASPELLRQSSETLAGRISYFELTPFLINEVETGNFKKLWLNGGYPGSYFETENEDSLNWRSDFITTFLERDIPMLGQSLLYGNISRTWQMCAHLTGQVLNFSSFASSLGVSGHTAKSYIDLLAKTYMIRLLPPYFSNLKKRIIKSPKLYIRDTGILHSLLDIVSRNSLLGHPSYGASWETFSIEQILNSIIGWKGYFYRTSSGNEIDLMLIKGNRKIAVEFKVSTAPVLSKGFYIAREDLKPNECWIISPVTDSYTFDRKKKIFVGNPLHLTNHLNSEIEVK